MKWLLWREYHLNRLILIAGAVLLILPYVFVLVGFCLPDAPAMTAFRAAQAFMTAAIWSVVLSQLTVALLGGNAIAGERADRSAEFIAYLPVSRTRRFAGKLSLAVMTTALIWGTNFLVLWILVSTYPKNVPYSQAFLWRDESFLWRYVAITGFVMYGVSWFISSIQSSPSLATLGGLITPLLVLMGLQFAAWKFGLWSHEMHQGTPYAFICIPLAVTCFSIGTWYYLNRVEP